MSLQRMNSSEIIGSWSVWDWRDGRGSAGQMTSTTCRRTSTPASGSPNAQLLTDPVRSLQIRVTYEGACFWDIHSDSVAPCGGGPEGRGVPSAP